MGSYISFPQDPSQTDHFSPEQEPQTQTEQPFSPALLQEEDDGHLCGKTMLVADWCPYPILPAVAQKCQVSHTISLLSGYHQLSAPQLVGLGIWFTEVPSTLEDSCTRWTRGNSAVDFSRVKLRSTPPFPSKPAFEQETQRNKGRMKYERYSMCNPPSPYKAILPSWEMEPSLSREPWGKNQGNGIHLLLLRYLKDWCMSHYIIP